MMTELEKLDQALTDADGRKWRYKAQQAEARAQDRADEAAACHEIMAECRNIAGEPHNSTVDAVRGLLARAEAAEAALAERNTPCMWSLQDDEFGIWEATCDELWQFFADGPVENNMKFCPNCGHPVEVAP